MKKFTEINIKLILFLILSVIILNNIHIASAHEVYVLNTNQIAQAIDTPSFNLFDVAVDNLDEFGFWAFIGMLTVFCVFWISTLRFLEKRLDPFFLKIRKYATTITRVTIGLSFLAGAYYQASYGPELPFINSFGQLSEIITILIAIIGVLITIGLYVRVSAFIALSLYIYAVYLHGWYMLTYINYLGEILVLFLLGAHTFSLEKSLSKRTLKKYENLITSSWQSLRNYFAPRSFAILRVLFGIGLIYSSYYAKVIYNNLALETVTKYHLDKILGFEPHFLILGAAIIEILIGVFFILGIEIRFTALFMLFWLTLSLIFFGEVVWPHLILIGIPIAYIFYGYDEYSLEGYLFRKKQYEPVL